MSVFMLLFTQCQMQLIKLWIWILPAILITTVLVNVYLLGYLHSTKCEYSALIALLKKHCLCS